MSKGPDGSDEDVTIPIFVKIVNGKGNKPVWRGWWNDPDNFMKAKIVYFPKLSTDPEHFDRSKNMALQAMRLEILKFYGWDRVVKEASDDEA